MALSPGGRRIGVGFLRTGVGGVAGSGLEKRECPVGVRDGPSVP
jgi:hypothetical protein